MTQHVLALHDFAAGEASKSGPIGFAVILALCIACYFLFKSMSRHLRRVREDYPKDDTPATPTGTAEAPATPAAPTPTPAPNGGDLGADHGVDHGERT